MLCNTIGVFVYLLSTFYFSLSLIHKPIFSSSPHDIPWLSPYRSIRSLLATLKAVLPVLRTLQILHSAHSGEDWAWSTAMTSTFLARVSILFFPFTHPIISLLLNLSLFNYVYYKSEQAVELWLRNRRFDLGIPSGLLVLGNNSFSPGTLVHRAHDLLCFMILQLCQAEWRQRSRVCVCVCVCVCGNQAQ